MSLNYYFTNCQNPVREVNDPADGGKMMNPVLHRLIWLTLSLNCSPYGGERNRTKFTERFKFYTENVERLTIGFGKEFLDLNPDWVETLSKEHLKPTKREGEFEYEITMFDVDKAWGLETNAYSSETTAKWKARIKKILKK